ncbi:bifunctional glutamate--cysteine ligase GshA/glutathione synthetase GshB [Streptococcus sp. H31]|uniref:bifunctional glutamate--cysteine ligase GshA/glutathione synthetase GshB n=1 Tax=Streptococcus huangxiaojuni TaxID=3237239 RepID=UPI0034A32CD5
MARINHILQDSPRSLPVLQATFGLERESLRINADHRLAQTPHPECLGSRDFHPYIQTDYSEPQMELITPVASSTKEALRFLNAITDVAQRSLEPTEYLWPLSMPPELREEEIEIAHLSDAFEYRYRKYLGDVYGKILQSMSGIHYNMELGRDLIEQLYTVSGYNSLTAFRNALHLKLAQNFLRYQWLLTYLYGASPIAEPGFLKEKQSGPVRSIRNSHLGYVNHENISVSYDSLQDYIEDIESCVADGRLIAEKEFYSPVRLRGSKHNRDYLTQGVTYLEFRCFDLNPYTPIGIDQKTLDTVHLFSLALLWLDSPEQVDKELAQAKDLNNRLALSHPLEKLPEDAPLDGVLTAMQAVITHFQLPSYYQELLEEIRRQADNPALTLAGRLHQEITQDSLAAFGRTKGQEHHAYAWEAHYALKGYENMELSTQMLLFDAIQQGIHFEILDETDQFLKLWHGSHYEYVKNGNMTAKDNYVVPLAMANKTVTKKILQEAGFPVPGGAEFSDEEAALRYYSRIKQKPIVVKPKSTNFGLGISIFKESLSLEAYEKALDIALAEDSAVLVEDYIEGTEYRFFILDGQCEAVLLRVAANITGDGRHTVRQLIDRKNANPLRGRDHRSPLEIIQLGEVEKLMLEQEGYQPDDILPQGLTVYLRRNSNISTGGDSIDCTESMDPSYKALAADMAKAMGAWVCGVDLIIPDKEKPATAEEPNCTCIELNFNPSMYMHTYCQEGPGQAITPKILAKLFPEAAKQP